MKAANSLSAQKKATFSTVINSNSMRDMIDRSLRDPARSARFVFTLISTVSASEKLRACAPDSIVSAALKGEGMNLQLSLGHYAIVPYDTTATFLMQYKGYIQLALRSGLYADIDAMEIREGEYKGRNPRTGKPLIQFISDDTLREQLPVVGYYAYFELKDGFFRSVYWNREKVLRHADRYSPAFQYALYEKILRGETLTEEEQRKTTSPWYDTGGQQEGRCLKTVLRNLLKSGYTPLSVDMISAFAADRDTEPSYTAPIEAVPVESVPIPKSKAPAAHEALESVEEQPPLRGVTPEMQDSFFGDGEPG